MGAYARLLAPCLLALSLLVAPAHAERIREVASVQGVRTNQLLGCLVGQSIVDLLSRAPGSDKPLCAQLGEMLRQSRLAKSHFLGQRQHADLTAFQKLAQYHQALLI